MVLTERNDGNGDVCHMPDLKQNRKKGLFKAMENLTREILPFVRSVGNGTADAAEQAQMLEKIVISLVKESVALRNRISSLVINYRRNSNEFELLNEKLTNFLTFIREKVLTKTSTITRRRKVIEELQKKLESLEEGLRKQADAIDNMANQASRDRHWSIALRGIAILCIIATVFTMNTTAITLATDSGIIVGGFTFFGDGVSETEIKDLSSHLQECRKTLAQHTAELDVVLWSDALSNHDD